MGARTVEGKFFVSKSEQQEIYEIVELASIIDKKNPEQKLIELLKKSQFCARRHIAFASGMLAGKRAYGGLRAA